MQKKNVFLIMSLLTTNLAMASAFPKTISCHLALSKDSSSTSCNDFTVQNTRQERSLKDICRFAAGNELSLEILESACDVSAAFSVCLVENTIYSEIVPTYYYINSVEDKKIAESSCTNMAGRYKILTAE